MSSFRPGGSKMSSSCQKSVYNSTLFVNLMHSVIDFEREERVFISSALCFELSWRCNSEAVFGVAPLRNVVYIVEDQKWVEVAVRQLPT